MNRFLLFTLVSYLFTVAHGIRHLARGSKEDVLSMKIVRNVSVASQAMTQATIPLFDLS